MVGQTLGRYQLEEKIGQGGMGEVYRAHDQRLNRNVAIKVLPPGLFSEESARRRFRKEALALASLNHPNIAIIYDFDSQEGVDFLVIEYIEGVTLSEKLQSGALRVEEAIRLGRQICDGLMAAHAHGVVHRDLKPANLRLTTDGRIKILDFGLARVLPQPSTELASTQSVSETHVVTGTLPYMSPEQLRGEGADVRSDIYSNGLVLYEMTTGHQAFPQLQPVELIGAILHKNPDPPSTIDYRVSPGLERIILKAIDKKPELRYQSAKEMGVDLDRLDSPSLSTTPSSHARRHRFQLRIVLSITLLLAVIATIPRVRHLVLGGKADSAVSGLTPLSTGMFLAVLPLRASAQDASLEYIGEGMSVVLSEKLMRLNGIHTSSPTAISTIDQAAPLAQVARKLGVNLIALGTVQGRDQDVRIELEVKDPSTGKLLGSETVKGSRQNLLKLGDQLLSALVTALKLKATPEELRAALADPTSDSDAYDLYLRGLGTRQPDAAMLLYSRALKKDPNFALASAANAKACLEKYKIEKSKYWFKRTLDFAARAERTNKNLPEVYFSLGYVYEGLGKSAEAIAQLKRGVQLVPNSDEGYVHLGNAYMESGQKEEAIAAYKKAIDVNPYYWAHHIVLGNAYWSYGVKDKAVEEFKRVTELDPENVRGWDNLGNAYSRLGKYEESITAYQKSLQLDPTYWSAYSNLGNSYFLMKMYPEAVRAFEKAVELGPNQELAFGNLADAYRAEGQTEKANATYAKAIALASADLKVNPKNTGAMADLALYYAKIGDSKRGMELIRRARMIDNQDVEMIYIQAAIESIAHRPQDAIRTLREAVSKGYPIRDAQADPELNGLRNFPEFEEVWNEFVKTPSE